MRSSAVVFNVPSFRPSQTFRVTCGADVHPTSQARTHPGKGCKLIKHRVEDLTENSKQISPPGGHSRYHRCPPSCDEQRRTFLKEAENVTTVTGLVHVGGRSSQCSGGSTNLCCTSVFTSASWALLSPGLVCSL